MSSESIIWDRPDVVMHAMYLSDHVIASKGKTQTFYVHRKIIIMCVVGKCLGTKC
jgi:hypothetical protein